MPKPWTKNVQVAFVTISQNLFVTNPTLTSLIKLWHKNYGSLRIVNCQALLTAQEVFELTTFQNVVMRDIEASKNTLVKKLVLE